MEFEPRHLQTLRGKPGKSTENVSYFFFKGGAHMYFRMGLKRIDCENGQQW